MVTEANYVAVIVCSDDRATMIARLLGEEFDVYRRSYSSENGQWNLSRWQAEAWESIATEGPPSPDVLFFHTGNNDPSGIPASDQYKLEFAFSGAGLRYNSIVPNRPAARPIPRRLMLGANPIRRHHVLQLVDHLSGHRSDLPGFCSEERNLAALSSLAIVLQTFLSVAIVEGELKEDSPAARAIGWTALSEPDRIVLSARLRADPNRLKVPHGLLRALSVETDESGKPIEDSLCHFLRELVEDLDIYAGTGARREVASDTHSTNVSEDLLSLVRGEPRLSHLPEVFSNPCPSAQDVAHAYTELHEVLSDK